MKFDSSIIHKPRSQPALQRGFFGVLTFAFWMAYAYLWLPLLTLILWVLGLRTAWFELYLRENRIEPFVLLALPLLALVCTLSLWLWAEYNRHRFSGRDRRRPQPHIRRSEIANALGASHNTAVGLSTSKIAVLHMNEAARPVSLSPVARLEEARYASEIRVYEMSYR